MKKIVSIVLIVMVIFLLGSVCVQAEEIDMNLPSVNVSTNTTDTNTANTGNNTVDNSATNNVANTVDTNNTNTPKVSTVNEIENSQLGITNILNIVLMVIGILLVLLSIAILIRLK